MHLQYNDHDLSGLSFVCLVCPASPYSRDSLALLFSGMDLQHGFSNSPRPH